MRRQRTVLGIAHNPVLCSVWLSLIGSSLCKKTAGLRPSFRAVEKKEHRQSQCYRVQINPRSARETEPSNPTTK